MRAFGARNAFVIAVAKYTVAIAVMLWLPACWEALSFQGEGALDTASDATDHQGDQRWNEKAGLLKRVLI